MVRRRSMLFASSLVAVCHLVTAAEFSLLGERLTVEYVNSVVREREQRDEGRVVASIPLETEGNSLPALDLLVGMDLVSQVASYGQRVGGLTEASQAWLIQHAKDVTVSQGVTLQNKAAIVLVTPYDVRAEAGRSDDGYVTMAMEGAISAALESTGTGDVFVLVTIGMSLCPSTAQIVGEMVVSTRGWGSFKTLHIEEFEGMASAINRAMAHIPAHTLVVILTPSFQGPLPISAASPEHLQQQATATRNDSSATGPNDIYSIYEASRDSALLLTVDVPADPQCYEGLRMPALVLDRDTYQALGPLDEGYMFQGALADYIERARGQGVHQDRPDLAPLLHSPSASSVCRRAPPSLFDQRSDVRRVLSGWAEGVDVMSAVLAPGDVERLAQQDMDTFFLAHHLQAWGHCTKAQDGLCVEEGRARAGGEMEYHAQWSGRRVTPSLVEEDWRSDVHVQQGGQRLRVAAVVCVYDDATLLRPLLLDLLGQLDHVVVLVSSVPWRGDVRGRNHHTVAMLGDLLARPEINHDRLSVVKGRWASEAEQRQFGNTLVMAMPGGFTHVMVVDSDEFWHPVELQQALNLVAKRPRSALPFAASKQHTYWKTLRTVVTPQEPLNMLWLLDPLACRWVRNRELDCSGGILIYGLATCHHLSYVRTTAELTERKLASFSHAHELQDTWFKDKWQAWDDNPSLEDLHPTEPEAYKATKPQPLYLLPPTLRRIYLGKRKALEDRASGRGQAGATEAAAVEEHDWMMTYVPPRCDIRTGDGNCSFSLSLLDSCTPTEVA